MSDEYSNYLIRQFDIAWKLMGYHLNGLSTQECLWRPADKGLHVLQTAEGRWVADWPDYEGYDLGPPSIAWLTWHVGFWWSMAFDYAFGAAALRREEVAWPGDAEGVRAWFGRLHDQWRARLERLGDADLRSTRRSRWPYRDYPFGDIVAWVNLELTKNAAEIGYARFLYAVSPTARP